MARISLVSQQLRRLAGGAEQLDIAAPTLRALLAALDERHPGLADEIEARMSIAIDGEIQHGVLDAPLAADSEVVLIPRIAGG